MSLWALLRFASLHNELLSFFFVLGNGGRTWDVDLFSSIGLRNLRQGKEEVYFWTLLLLRAKDRPAVQCMPMWWPNELSTTFCNLGPGPFRIIIYPVHFPTSTNEPSEICSCFQTFHTSKGTQQAKPTQIYVKFRAWFISRFFYSARYPACEENRPSVVYVDRFVYLPLSL